MGEPRETDGGGEPAGERSDAAREHRAEGGAGRPPSFGNVGEHHWSRARAGSNREAIEYYRSRSRAPGVADGGAERNFYCMRCDGVIPHDHAGSGCPHCAAPLEGVARRYFNWVEIDQPPTSDAGPLLRIAALAAALLVALGALAWWFFARSG